MSGELQIVVGDQDLTDEGRARVARELRSWITQHVPDSKVEEVAAGPPRPGQKGLEIVAGTLAVLISSGTVKALVDCIATYVRERRRSVKLEVSNASGEHVTVAADNVGQAELDRLVTQLGAIARVEPPRAPAS